MRNWKFNFAACKIQESKDEETAYAFLAYAYHNLSETEVKILRLLCLEKFTNLGE